METNNENKPKAIDKAFAFSSGGLKGIYSFGIWDQLFYRIVNNNKDICKRGNYIFSGSSIGSMVATKAFHDIQMYQNGINKKKIHLKQKAYYDFVDEAIGSKDSIKYGKSECEKSSNKDANPSEFIKILTNNYYTVNPIWLILQCVINLLKCTGFLFKDTRKNQFIEDYITHQPKNQPNNQQKKEYEFDLNSKNLELRVSATDMLSGKNIIFETNFVNTKDFDNGSILYRTKLDNDNITNVLSASSSIPIVFNQIKCYLDKNNKITFDQPIEKSTKLHLYDGGVSTDFCTNTLFNDLVREDATLKQIIIFDVDNYLTMFNKSDMSFSCGLLQVLSTILNSYDKYVKYNDLLELIIPNIESIGKLKITNDNPFEANTTTKTYNESKSQDKDYIHIVTIISTINKDPNQNNYDGFEVNYYKSERTTYLNLKLDEIIYIGTNAQLNLSEIFTNQTRLNDFIPKMYVQGKKIADFIYDSDLLVDK